MTQNGCLLSVDERESTEVSTLKLQQAQLTHRSRNSIILWLVGGFSPSFGNVDVLRIQNMGSGGDGGHTCDGCDGKTTCESTNDIPTQPIDVFLLFFAFQLVHGDVRSSPHLQRQKELWGRWWEHIQLLWQKHELVKTQTSKLCSGWILTFFCTEVVQRDRRTAPPPSMVFV
jgi:hypothetical protein